MSEKIVITTYFESNVEAILSLLNAPEEWGCGLTELLQEKIDWSEIDPKTIIPKLELRRFTKSINDKEVRLDVMKFLLEYASYYFYDSALQISETVNDANAKMNVFQSELATQINQIEKTGMFSGDRFNKLQKRVAQLEEENKEYKNANKYLQEKVDRFEHPEKYNKYIPSELRNRKFGDIMKYLQSVQIALPIYANDTYGKVITCYQWYGKKGLFGYFVDKLNFEFELNEAREQLNWKIFEPAFNNFDKLINEARKAVSNYKNDPKAQFHARADYIDNAIKYANGELKEKDDRI